jgi:hypothetical protein
VFLATHLASAQVGRESRNRGIGIRARQLEFDALIEHLEALIAADLCLCRPEQSLEGLR